LLCIVSGILDILLLIINLISGKNASGTYLLFNLIVSVADFILLSFSIPPIEFEEPIDPNKVLNLEETVV